MGLKLFGVVVVAASALALHPRRSLTTLRRALEAPDGREEERFPTAETPPAEVVRASLRALSAGNLTRTFELFSRARRAVIVEDGRSQGGGGMLDRTLDVEARVRHVLETSCPGLLFHASSEVISGLAINGRSGGRLPRWRGRVKVRTFSAEMFDSEDGGFLRAAAEAAPPAYFVFTLTRQHDPPPTPRELASIDCRETARFDGFDGCWFVWKIEPERRRGGNDDADDDAAPDPEGPSTRRAPPRRSRVLT